MRERPTFWSGLVADLIANLVAGLLPPSLPARLTALSPTVSATLSPAVRLLLTAPLLLPGFVLADSTEELIREIRAEIQAQTDLVSLGAGYAAMANFAVVPDISSATYNIDDDSANDQELSVLKIPLKYHFPEFSSGLSPFVQVNLASQDLDAGFRFLPDEGVRTEWTTRAISIASGVEIPLGESLTLSPVLDFGILDLENSSRYYGSVSTNILQPAFENLIFDWDAKARLFGASVALDYQQQFQGRELRVHSSLTRNYVETYSTSSPAVEFSHGATTFSLDSELIVPTSMSLFDRPVALVPQVNYTTFLGSDRDELGFSDFFKAGLAGEIDISSLDYGINKLRLGLELVKGNNVEGIVFELGYRY